MQKAVIYHRVSTADQDPKAATRELMRAAHVRQFKIVDIIEEVGGGARNDRAGLRKVLDAARSGHVDAVLVWKLDRFGRSAIDVLTNIQMLNDDAVRFIAVSQSLDIKPDGDALSKLILTVLASVAEFERDLIRERTRLGLAKARAAGKLLGRRISRTAPSPAKVAQKRAGGHSWREIGVDLGCTIGAARRALARLAGNGTAVLASK